MTERLHFHFSLSCIGEGNGNPLQCSCLENCRDGGAWWAGILSIFYISRNTGGFPGSSVIKNPPPKQETRVRSLVQEDPLEKEMGIHSSILAWKIPWTEKSGGLQSTGSQRVGHDRETSFSLSLS